MAGLREEIRNSFRDGDALNRLILINLGVFLLYYILKILGNLFQASPEYYFIQWTALPSNLSVLITRPWTLFTYMFLHQGFMHILFNMLILFFTGRIFMEYMGGRKLLSIYLLGGLAGGLLYVIFYNIFPGFQEQLATSNNRGASAGVMAVLIGAATYAPRYPVKLFFVLNVEFRWVALMLLFTDLINLGDGNNMGGHIAHLGGAALGYIAVSRYKNGNDITEGFSKFMDNIANWFKPRPKIRKVYSKAGNNRHDYNERKAQNQERMNDILDKINRSGYDSLTKDEKDYLFKIGKD
jgi:membrane associated rhomboid family serine protease